MDTGVTDSKLSLLRRYSGAIALYCAMTMTVLDSTIMNVALPTLQHIMGVERTATIWVVNAYQLVIAMLLLPFASLGELYGYKRVFLWGVVVFTLSSAACAASQSLTMLIVCRLCEGVGAAAVMSVTLALTRLVYPPSEIGPGMAVNAVVVGVASAAGPTLCGAILSIASWHWLFLINIPIGIGAVVVGRRFLPQNPSTTAPKGRFDIPGAIECALLFGLLIYTLEAASRGVSVYGTILRAVVIVTVAWMFLRREAREPEPLFPVDLLRRGAFPIVMSASMCNFIAQMLVLVSLPFFLKDNLGYNALHTGLLISPWPLAVMLVAPLAGWLVKRVKTALLCAVGMAIFAGGLLLLFLLPAGAHWADIAWRMFVCGIGFGLFKTPNNVAIIQSSPMARNGAASGMKGVARQFGQTLGTTTVMVLFHTVPARESARWCLIAAMGVALLSAQLSITRIHDAK